MIKQDNLKNVNLRRYGCYFMCLVLSQKPELTEEELDALYVKAFNAGIIRGDCYVVDPFAVLAMASQPTWHWTQRGEEPNVVIECWHKEGLPESTHFKLVKPVEYDPMEDSSKYCVHKSDRRLTRV